MHPSSGGSRPESSVVECGFVTEAGIVYPEEPYRPADHGGRLTKGDSAHENA
jgi:hypothetical protein